MLTVTCNILFFILNYFSIFFIYYSVVWLSLLYLTINVLVFPNDLNSYLFLQSFISKFCLPSCQPFSATILSCLFITIHIFISVFQQNNCIDLLLVIFLSPTYFRTSIPSIQCVERLFFSAVQSYHSPCNTGSSWKESEI